MFQRWRWTLSAAALLACALLALPALAKGKPGGGGGNGGGGSTPAGTVYFTLGTQMHTMDADGSNKAALSGNVGGVPSHDLHGGSRWFLQVRNTVDGFQLFAVRDDGNESASVRLTTSTGLEVFVGNPSRPAPRWGPGDSQVSFVGRRSSGGSVVEGGIYLAAITFDGGGNVVGLAAQPGSPVVSATIQTVNQVTGPNIDNHDWSPDGTRMVHNTLDASYVQQELTVVVLGTGSTTTFATTDPASGPVWSPDGSAIAYSSWGIYTIRPDGTGEARIVRPKGGGNFVHYAAPQWAPTGAHLICQGSGSIDSGRADIYRIASDGRGKTNLTGELDTHWTSPGGTPATPVAWR